MKPTLLLSQFINFEKKKFLFFVKKLLCVRVVLSQNTLKLYKTKTFIITVTLLFYFNVFNKNRVLYP